VSRENVEASLRGFRLFETGQINEIGDLYSEDAEIWHPEGWPEPGPSVGRDEVISQFRTLREGWAENEVEIREIEDLGDWVVAQVTWKGRTEKTDAVFEMPYCAATRFGEDGLIAEVHYTWQYDEALAAVERSDAGRVARDGEAEPA
jgi:ketosteroid isomerase-like protein